MSSKNDGKPKSAGQKSPSDHNQKLRSERNRRLRREKHEAFLAFCRTKKIKIPRGAARAARRAKTRLQFGTGA